ncbi:MAG: NAD(P)H-quinone oxidoreductase subunit O [Leptolyngbyaceae cyanobacterium]
MRSDMAGGLRRGDVVRAVREKLENSVEATASDTRFPPYLFETKGEILETRDDYALVMFGSMPTPNIWLRLDQLEKFE